MRVTRVAAFVLTIFTGHREARELYRVVLLRPFIDRILAFCDFNGNCSSSWFCVMRDLSGLVPYDWLSVIDNRTIDEKISAAIPLFVNEIQRIKQKYSHPTPSANMTPQQRVEHLALSFGADVPFDDDQQSDYSDDERAEEKAEEKRKITWGVLNKQGQDACDRICVPATTRALFVARRFRHL